jgi:hypothetical protein
MEGKFEKYPNNIFSSDFPNFQHAVSLPFFAFMGQDIMRSAAEFSTGPSFHLVGMTLPISAIWIKLLLNCILQWLCIMFESF